MPVRPTSPDSTCESYTEFPQDSRIDGYNTPGQRMSLSPNSPHQYRSLPPTSQHGHDYTTRQTLTLQRPYKRNPIHQSNSNLFGGTSLNQPKMGLGVSNMKRRQRTRSTPDLHLSEMETYSFRGDVGSEGLVDTYIDSDSDLSRRAGDGHYTDHSSGFHNGSQHSLDIESDHFFNVNSQFTKYCLPNHTNEASLPSQRNHCTDKSLTREGNVDQANNRK